MQLDHGYLTIARIGGDPAELVEQYRRSNAVMNEVGRDHGLIVHVGAAGPDGLVLVNLWPSVEGSESAARDPRRVEQISIAGLSPGDVTREHHAVAQAVVF